MNVVSEGNRYRSLALAGTVPKGLDFLRLDFGIIGVCVILWDATISGGLLKLTKLARPGLLRFPERGLNRERAFLLGPFFLFGHCRESYIPGFSSKVIADRRLGIRYSPSRVTNSKGPAHGGAFRDNASDKLGGAPGYHAPNYENDNGANYCANKTGSLTCAVPADGLAKIGRDERSHDAKNSRQNKTCRLVWSRMKEFSNKSSDESDYNSKDYTHCDFLDTGWQRVGNSAPANQFPRN